ncbi:MAG: hypothetical protein JW969_17975 [Spirochaetales bacterium]|nr:hypothetical protein [Spirochaetales bacterium]
MRTDTAGKIRLYKILFTAAVLLFSANTGSFAELVYYKSNSVGMKISLIRPDEINKSEYYLTIEKSDDLETRKLYTNGTEIKKWEIRYYASGIKQEEKELENDRTVNVNRYNTQGKITEELVFNDNKLSSTVLYTYSGDQLSYIDVLDEKGNQSYRETYSFTKDGSLRQVIRTYPDGKKQVSSYSIISGNLIQEAYQIEDQYLISQFEPDGRIWKREKWLKDTLVSRIIYKYRQGSKHVESEREENFTDKKVTVRLFDNESHLISEKTDIAGKTIESYKYTWQNGKKIRMEKRSGEGLEEWIYSYNAKNELSKEEYYLKGRIERVTYHTEKDSYYEEIYKVEVLRIKVFYKEGEKIREEFYSDGKLIREKIYGENEE